MLLLNTAQGLVTAADLWSVRQRESLFILVKIDEVYSVWQGRYFIHNEPSIILWHRELIKVYVLRSNKVTISICQCEWQTEVCVRLTYLNMPILVIKVRNNII